jgi:hypothetical protein
MKPNEYASKFNSWEKLYNWDTCKTNRREFGLFIADFLTTDSRVINLNGAYGSGKTEFIRRMYVELAGQEYPVVYIDAWESDFSNNPLAVICSEMLQQIEFIFKTKAPSGKAKDKKKAIKIINSLKQKLGHCLKYIELGATFAGELATVAITKTLSAAVKDTPDFNIQTSSEGLIETVQKNHINAVQAIKDIKESISFLADMIDIVYGLNVPIVILIDELDRCRPTYAIEFLESIKHFFETEGCTFLVATNTEVLECSVKAVYGEHFDAQLYLRRFFDRKVTLPQISILEYLKLKELDFEKYNQKNLKLYPFYENQKDNIALFSALFEDNNIELRDVEQILNRFFAGLDYTEKYHSGTEVILNTVILLAGLLKQHLGFPKTENSATDINHGPFFAIVITGPKCDELSYTVNSMLSCMYKCVNTTLPKVVYEHGGSITRRSPSQKTLEIKTEDSSKFKLPFENNSMFEFINKIIEDYSRTDCKYLMWEDHQKIIELSGHID